jgi:hypothetical protein
MNIDEIRGKATSSKWHIGKYAAWVYIITVLVFFIFGVMMGFIFYPIIKPL